MGNCTSQDAPTALRAEPSVSANTGVALVLLRLTGDVPFRVTAGRLVTLTAPVTGRTTEFAMLAFTVPCTGSGVLTTSTRSTGGGGGGGAEGVGVLVKRLTANARRLRHAA